VGRAITDIGLDISECLGAVYRVMAGDILEGKTRQLNLPYTLKSEMRKKKNKIKWR
jgi:hypothetical protein